MARSGQCLLSVVAMSVIILQSLNAHSAGQEPVPRKSAFTTFVGPCLLPVGQSCACIHDHSKNLAFKHG